MSMVKTKYSKNQILMEGIIVGIKDGSVSMDLKGRLGFLSVPRRMLISDYELKLGQEVAFVMSFPEVVNDQPNEHYIGNMKKLQGENQSKQLG